MGIYYEKVKVAEKQERNKGGVGLYSLAVSFSRSTMKNVGQKDDKFEES